MNNHNTDFPARFYPKFNLVKVDRVFYTGDQVQDQSPTRIKWGNTTILGSLLVGAYFLF